MSKTRKSVWKSDETFFRVFDIASQTIHFCFGEIQSKSSPNFVIIKITFLNLLHGGDFFVFLS